METKTKFFIPNNLRVSGLNHIPLLYSLWGVPEMKGAPYAREVFEHYNSDPNFFELVNSPKSADFVLMPYRYNLVIKKAPGLFEKYVVRARSLSKPLLVDGTGDIEHPIADENTYALRVSQYRFRTTPRDIMIPSYASDLLERFRGGRLTLREKKETPSVGFVGWASLNMSQRIKANIKEIPIYAKEVFNKKYGALHKGIFFREKAIKALSASSGIKPNFRVRSSYGNHRQTMQGDPDDLRKEFVDVLDNSDYGLTVKGDANSSVRFYEILSMGRIPLFVDTECVLPLEDKIKYDDFICRVNFRDIKSIGRIAGDFHKKLSPEQFVSMQKKAREVFERYLRVDVFTKHLMEKLKNISLARENS